MIRGLPTTILSACVAGMVGVGLFFIKHEVKEQEARLSELNQEIRRNQEVIHVLKAEWSYLNDPARLRALSEKFLAMKVMAPNQIVTLNTLPAGGPVYAAARPTNQPAAVARAEPAKAAPALAPAPVATSAAIAKAEPVKAPAKPALAKVEPARKPAAPAAAKLAAAPAPLPAVKAPIGQPGKPAVAPAPTKVAQPAFHPASTTIARPLPAPPPSYAPAQPGRTIVIQSPAIAETPGYPGEVR